MKSKERNKIIEGKKLIKEKKEGKTLKLSRRKLNYKRRAKLRYIKGGKELN